MKKIFFLILLFFFFFCQTSWAAEYIFKYQGQKKIGYLNTNNILSDAQIERMKKDKNLEIVEQNFTRSILSAPNDKYYSDQWYLPAIDIEDGWKLEKGDDKTVIAVLDTGIDIDHNDLENNIWVNKDEIPNNNKDDDNNGYIDDVHGWDFVNNNNNPKPDLSGKLDRDTIVHGTHVAGTIAAQRNNEIGVSGICPKCQIMPLEVLNDQGEGSTKHIYTAIEYAIANGADIINLSFGSYDYSAIEAEAIEDAVASNIIIVSAAGNNNRNLNYRHIYPACHEKVLGVGAVDTQMAKASFSNYGDECVDVSAPGSSIFNTFYKNKSQGLDDAYGYMSGTSMSTPVVSGLAGLLKSYQSDLSRKKIYKYIKDYSIEYNLGEKMGKGVINVYNSLKAVKKDYQ